MFYYLGWVVIFLTNLYVIHFLSKHLKLIVVSCIKFSLALSVTLSLAAMVFVYENMNQELLETILKDSIKLVNEYKARQQL